MNNESHKPKKNTNEFLNNVFGFSNEKTKKQEAVENDRRINDLATYAVTKGLTLSIMDHQEELLPMFTQFKMLVRRGSFTLAQLENMIIDKYGIVKKEPHPLDDIVFLDEEPEPYELNGDEE